MGSCLGTLRCFRRKEKDYTRIDNVLMIGLDAAGKTTCLQYLAKGQSDGTMLPTIGFNVESIKYRNLEFKLWDVGGQSRLRQVWHHYYQSAQAVVFVIDCNDIERIGRKITVEAYRKQVRSATMNRALIRAEQRRQSVAATSSAIRNHAHSSKFTNHPHSGRLRSNTVTVSDMFGNLKVSRDDNNDQSTLSMNMRDDRESRKKSSVQFWMENCLDGISKDIPVLILANKQDLPKSVTVSELIDILDLISVLRDREWHCQPTVATRGTGIHLGFDWLIRVLRHRRINQERSESLKKKSADDECLSAQSRPSQSLFSRSMHNSEHVFAVGTIESQMRMEEEQNLVHHVIRH